MAFVAQARVGNQGHARPSPRQFIRKNSRIRFSPSRGRSRPSIASPLRSGLLRADRIVSSMSQRSADVVRIPLAAGVLSLLDTHGGLAAGSPPAASFFTLRFCGPVSALIGAWIHACVVPRWDATGRHRACAKEFRFASLQVLFAEVQALHRHGTRTGQRTLHRHVKAASRRTAAASRCVPPVRICVGARANTSNDGQTAAFKCNFAFACRIKGWRAFWRTNV